jgi:exonuclease SbcC
MRSGLKSRRINDELIVQTELESQFQKLKLTAEKIQLLKNQLQSLESQRPTMQLREEVLRTFEICSLHFKSLLDQKANLSGAIARDQKMFEANQVRTADLAVILEKQKRDFAPIETAI